MIFMYIYGSWSDLLLKMLHDYIDLKQTNIFFAYRFSTGQSQSDVNKNEKQERYVSVV